MKKIIFGALGLTILGVIIVATAGFYKFNILEDDIYVQTESGNVVQYNDIIQASASIIPLASLVNTIGGDYVDAQAIVPAGVSPHSFDLSARDAVAIEKSDITFVIGLEQIDGFLEKTLQGKNHVELARGMELLEASAHNHDDHGDENEDEHDDAHHDEEDHQDEDDHSVDAHVWLGKENIILMAQRVRDELSEILPEQAELFAENTEIFISDVESIYSNFAEKTSGKSPREFIVFHDAYNYLMESVTIDSDLKIPFSENVLHQSGTAHMAELIEEIELHGVVNIFSEPQFSDGNLQDFAQQYNLTVGILDPLGSDDSSTGYLENLKTNLDNLSLIYE